MLCCLQSSASEASETQQQEVAELQELFQECRDALQPGEPASAFTCPITMEVFRDPVMTPSGLSYERTALLEHLKKVRTIVYHLLLQALHGDGLLHCESLHPPPAS